MNREQEIQRELIRRKQLEEQQRKQQRLKAGLSAGKFGYDNRDTIKNTISSMIDNFKGTNTSNTPSLNTTSSGSFGSNLASGAGGAIGGAVGSYGADKLSDTIGVDGIGKEALKMGGSIAGNAAGTAITNAATNAIANAATTAATTAGTTAAAGGAAAGAGSTLAAGAAGGPIGLAAAAIIAALQYGWGKLQEKKQEQKQNRAMSKAYSEQGHDEMQQYADKIKEDNEKTKAMIDEALANQNQQTQETQQPTIPTDLAGYQQYMRDNGYSEDAVKGVEQGLNMGDKNVSDWINSYNEANPDNSIRIPQTEGEISLAREGKFNVPTEEASILAKVGDIMSQVKSGYQDNRGSSFALENLAPDATKTGWNKLGEALGTGARIVANPYVQGTVAGALHGIDKQDALYGLARGWEWADNKSKSDKYYEAITGKKNAPIMGGYDLGDYKAHVANENAQREYDRKVANDLIAQEMKKKEYEMNLRKAEETARHNKAMEGLYDKKVKLTSGEKTTKADKEALYNADLAEFVDIFNGGDQGQIEYARKVFMQEHGKDPFKYIKLASDWEEQVGY